jgi:protein-tyrosine phosphatase
MTDKTKKHSSPKRTRKTTHKQSLEDYILKHSPLKAGVRLENEDKPLAKYNKIIDKLYLGNYQAAKDREFFKTKNIKAVLNCTKEIPNHFAHNKEIEYMRIPVDDSLKEKDYELMYQYFPVIVEFIYKHVVLQKHNILINCHAGRQRSAISVAAFLVAKHGMTPHEACKYVMSKRKEVFHHGKSLNFSSSLTKYYKTLTRK